MTTSANASFELTRDGFLRRVFQLAGVWPSHQTASTDNPQIAADIEMAADFLGTELDMLQAEGIVLRTVERDTVSVAASASSVTLDSDTLDVVVQPGDLLGMVYTSTSAQSRVRSITRADYLGITNKDTEGVPSMGYVEKAGTSVSVLLWPKPSEAMTLLLARVRFIRDADTGAVTLEVARAFQKALLYSVAAMVAEAKNQADIKVSRLQSTGEALKRRARAFDTEPGYGQLVVR